MKKLLVLAGLALMVGVLVVGCGATAEPHMAPALVEKSVEVSDQASYDARQSVGGAGMSGEEAAAQVERMVIWTADLSLLVKDGREALEQVQGVARSLGGYTVGSETWLQDEQLYARVTIRVPAERFEDAMSRLRDLALEVSRESANSQDVTDEYVDLESRLRHLEAKEAQLLEFLAEAEDTEAVLAVYDHLSQTQLEIEQARGRMSYLEKLVAMATITVHLAPEEAIPAVVEEGWQPGRTLRQAARALVSTLQAVGDFIIWFAIYVLPVLLVVAIPIAVLVWAIRRWHRRRRGRTG